jgi:hypothetical protein
MKAVSNHLASSSVRALGRVLGEWKPQDIHGKNARRVLVKLMEKLEKN